MFKEDFESYELDIIPQENWDYEDYTQSSHTEVVEIEGRNGGI